MAPGTPDPAVCPQHKPVISTQGNKLGGLRWDNDKYRRNLTTETQILRLRGLEPQHSLHVSAASPAVIRAAGQGT